MALPDDPRPEVLLFDLGGVIVELSGVLQWRAWTGLSEEEVWSRWLRSPAVRAFESGRTGPDDFARAVVAEFELPIAPAEFLDRFATWPRGIYPGALELVHELRQRYRVACLSNCNAIHWPRFTQEMGLAAAFDACFSSHELGCLKPDREVFLRVARELGTGPERILFLDDNALNVDGARASGLTGHRVRGLDEARALLRELGIHAAPR